MSGRSSLPGQLAPRARGTCAGGGERFGIAEELAGGGRQRLDVARRDDSAGAVLRDRLRKAADVVRDGRHPGAERLEQRSRLVELGTVGKDGDRRLRERAVELARGEVAETPLGA